MPIIKSKKGEEISKELNGTEWAKGAVEEAIKHNVINASSSFYSIQEHARWVVKESSGHDYGVFGESMRVRMFYIAYREGLDIKDVLETLAIDLRDAIFDHFHLSPPTKSLYRDL